MNPPIFRDQPVELRYGFGETSLGVVVAAFSGAGVAAIFLGSDRMKLRCDLTDAFASLTLIEDQAATALGVGAIAATIDDPRKSFDLPLDIRGSAIELVVWSALRRIPVGETRSYGQIARSLPLPATAQEVGAACAANVLAVAVPCHRVLKADGSISGYRWGVSRKRRLLEKELALQPPPPQMPMLFLF